MVTSEAGIVWLPECESTNDEAWARIDDADVRAVVAHRQTGGRGRRGRQWVSPPGTGLYLTWMAHPSFPPAAGPALPLLAAVAVAEMVVAAGARPWLKWPNDVCIGDRKLAGILSEARTAGDSWAAVVGVGINLRSPPGGWPLSVPGIALEDATPDVPEAHAAARDLVARLDRWLARVETEGLAPVLQAWQSWAPPAGTHLRQGDHEGIYAGLAPDGALRLRTADGTVQTIRTGEVELVRYLPATPSATPEI
jgi:BirA family biotin operon repressor/biotin-[acetyl-CoA-carboxylase] ligase